MNDTPKGIAARSPLAALAASVAFLALAGCAADDGTRMSTDMRTEMTNEMLTPDPLDDEFISGPGASPVSLIPSGGTSSSGVRVMR